MQKRTKIVCTMGPATDDDKVLEQLILNGMNVARFNFSHGTHEYHRKNIERVRAMSKKLGIPVAIMLDTKGPEIRTGLLKDHKPIQFNVGEHTTVTTDNTIVGTHNLISLDYKNLAHEVKPGTKLLIDDGLIGLKVESVEGEEVHCVVESGGELGERKGVNVPNLFLNLPSVTEQDRSDITFGCKLGIDAIAASFIRDANAVKEIRQICYENGQRHIDIFPKIESALGVKNFDEILAASNGCMVARGDLGVEVPTEKVPHIQKTIIRKCNLVYKPVITATQMLDSMIRNPRPTRAEANDVANAVYDGTDCVMLSGETAAGHYPVEAVKTMASICMETEKYLQQRETYHEREGLRNVNSSIGFAAVTTAQRVNAKCIIAPTHSGRTARLISNFRPHLPIIALSPSDHTIRKCCFYWGVEAIKSVEQGSLSATLYESLDVTKEHKFIDSGDIVVLTAGDPQTSPSQGDYITSTNMLMVAQVQ